MPHVMACALVAMVLGAGMELKARLFNFWRYASPASPVLNVVLMFGAVQGAGVAGVVGGRLPLVSIGPVIFMIGALIGVAYEGLNSFRLHSWSWPEGTLLDAIGLRRPLDKAAAVGVGWGAIPVLSALIVRLPALSQGIVG